MKHCFGLFVLQWSVLRCSWSCCDKIHLQPSKGQSLKESFPSQAGVLEVESAAN